MRHEDPALMRRRSRNIAMLTALPQKMEHSGNATLLLRILATDAAVLSPFCQGLSLASLDPLSITPFSFSPALGHGINPIGGAERKK